MSKSFTIEQVYYFASSPEEVFQALTDSKVLVKWFLSKAELSARKDGDYTFDWVGGYHMTGKVKRFETNKVVSFTWSDRLKSGELANTTASFEVTKKGKGTLLKLRHVGFEDPEHFADCSSRWGYYLMNMKSVLDNGKDLRSEYDW